MPGEAAFSQTDIAQSGWPAACFRSGEIVAFLGAFAGDREAVGGSAALPLGCARLGPDAELYRWLSVGDNVAFGADGLTPFTREGLVANALARVGLAGFEARRLDQLSPEQRHAVAIARLFVTRPKFLLLDEPFAGLPGDAQDRLFGLVLTLWSESRPGIVLAGGDLDRALLLADRILLRCARTGGVAGGFVNLQPRPRDLRAPGLQSLRREILRALPGSARRLETPELSVVI